jgi:hypothetical protein
VFDCHAEDNEGVKRNVGFQGNRSRTEGDAEEQGRQRCEHQEYNLERQDARVLRHCGGLVVSGGTLGGLVCVLLTLVGCG